LALNNPSVG